jgi:hypothetical protein
MRLEEEQLTTEKEGVTDEQTDFGMEGIDNG